MNLSNLFGICTPLVGLVFAPFFALFFAVVGLCMRHGVSLYGITLGIPTLIATCAWITESRKTRTAFLGRFLFNVVIPLACIILFVVHPVGHEAFLYSCYWFIPPLLFCARFFVSSRFDLFFCASVRITFIAHAVGSILWIYQVPTTPEFWMVLIPVVACERLINASMSSLFILLGSFVVAKKSFFICVSKLKS